MAESLSGVNGQIIRWARERYNMTTEEAAAAIGVDSDRYLHWESGDESPSYAKLKKISDVFHKPSALFFFPAPPEIPSVKGDLRTLPDVVSNRLSKQVIQQFEKARMYQFDLRELYGDKDSILAHREMFPLELSELCDYIRSLLSFPISAQKARKSDKVVFEIFREKFYELGIYVFKDAFKDDSVSGLCLNDNQFPIIVINNSMSFARQNFTLFHELYHLIANTSGAEIIRDEYYVFLDEPQSKVEKMCDSFANEFLVPMQDFEMELKKKPLDEQRIEELAKIYAVSKEAIMYKLYMMKIITSAEYEELKEFFYGDAVRNKKHMKNSENSGGNHYYTKLSYLGRRYTEAVFHQYFSGKIDSFKASEMLRSKVDHLPKLESAFFRGVK